MINYKYKILTPTGKIIFLLHDAKTHYTTYMKYYRDMIGATVQHMHQKATLNSLIYDPGGVLYSVAASLYEYRSLCVVSVTLPLNICSYYTVRTTHLCVLYYMFYNV